MKRLFVVAALLCAVALAFTMPARAGTVVAYKWVTATWGSDSTYTYLRSGVSGGKACDIIPLPVNAAWPAAADSIPFVIVGTMSGAGAAGDTLHAQAEFSWDGTNYLPAVTVAANSNVLVGTGTYWSLRILPMAAASLATARTVWNTGRPNTYHIQPMPRGARAMRVYVKGTAAGWTGNRYLKLQVGIPIVPTPVNK